jgi:hypothetical protein
MRHVIGPLFTVAPTRTEDGSQERDCHCTVYIYRRALLYLLLLDDTFNTSDVFKNILAGEGGLSKESKSQV